MGFISAINGGVLNYNAEIFEYDWNYKEDFVKEYMNFNA